jgi:hypothetical protein
MMRFGVVRRLFGCLVRMVTESELAERFHR